jgi:hypothetical protein
MAAIRVHYLTFQYILQETNDPSFTDAGVPAIISKLKELMATEPGLDRRFIALNKGYLYDSELKQENDLRNIRVQLLYDRLSRKK